LPSYIGWRSPLQSNWCNGNPCTLSHTTSGAPARSHYNYFSDCFSSGKAGLLSVRVDSSETMNWRAIGYASKPTALGHPSSPSWAAGQLNMAPNGIGFLLTSGYLADALVFYCPSSSAMPGDWRQYTPGGECWMGPTNLSSWKTIGGFDAASFLYGDYSHRSLTYYATPDTGKPFLCHYGYRNVRFGMYNAWHSYQDNTFRIPGVKPDVYARANQPYFRTARELGARAIATDTFSKGSSFDALGKPVWNAPYTTGSGSIADSRSITGLGVHGHRNSYNVVYGDGHVAPFGDPQESFIWHTQGISDTFPRGVPPHVLCMNYYYGSGDKPFGYATTAEPKFANSALSLWHDLDAAGGMDTTQ